MQLFQKRHIVHFFFVYFVLILSLYFVTLKPLSLPLLISRMCLLIGMLNI